MSGAEPTGDVQHVPKGSLVPRKGSSDSLGGQPERPTAAPPHGGMPGRVRVQSPAEQIPEVHVVRTASCGPSPWGVFVSLCWT